MGFNCDFDSVELRLKLLLPRKLRELWRIALPQDFTSTKLTLKILRHRYTPQQFSVFRQEKCEDCLTVS